MNFLNKVNLQLFTIIVGIIFILIIPFVIVFTNPIIIFIAVLSLLIITILILSRKYAELIITIVFFLLYLVFYFLDKVTFTYIPQVLALFKASVNPINILIAGHQWGPRYFISYPAVYLSKLFNMNIDAAFSIYCILLFYLMIILIMQIGKVIDKSKIRYGLISLFIVLMLTLIMNGRLASAYFGLTLILYIQLKVVRLNRGFNLKEYFIMFIGFFMSTVSSGTMIVSLIQILTISILLFIKYRNGVISLILFQGIFLYYSSGYILKMINKNLIFFGGGISSIIDMLSHGLGEYIFLDLKILIILISSMPILLLFIKKMYKKYFNYEYIYPLVLSLPISIICGLFGISTASMIIPSLIILLSYILRTEKYSSIPKPL